MPSYKVKGYYEVKDIFNCYKGINDEIFIKENLVIEIPCSSSLIMSFIQGLILSKIFKLKSANPELLKYKNLIIFEDIQSGLGNA